MEYLEMLIPRGVFRFSHKNERVDFLLFAVLLMNHLWEVRNDLVFSRNPFQLETSIQRLNIKFRDFQSFRDPPSNLVVDTDAEKVWSPPPTGFIKLNLDVA